MLGDGQYCRRLEEDAAVLVLPHQIALVRMAWEYGAPCPSVWMSVGSDISATSDLGIVRR